MKRTHRPPSAIGICGGCALAMLCILAGVVILTTLGPYICAIGFVVIALVVVWITLTSTPKQ